MKVREKNPMISVIVPTYNSAKTLEICLKSVKKQTYSNIEIIVVDNNSADNTRKIAEKYGKVFIKGPERSAQRNFGARQSNGEYLVFLDSDIELTPRVIEECMRRVDEGSAAVIFREITVGEGFWAKCRALESRCVIGDDLIEAPRFYKARVFNEVNGYDESLVGWEDWDLSQRVRQRGFKVARVDPLTMHHEGKVSLIKRIKKKYYYGKTVKKYIEKHKGVSKRQIPLFRSAYFRSWKLLVKDPVHALGFTIMKMLESIATALGLIIPKYSSDN
jgi:glycosyltransferase involved in cell wall biosynthesis